jgi:hypothetical protein
MTELPALDTRRDGTKDWKRGGTGQVTTTDVATSMHDVPSEAGEAGAEASVMTVAQFTEKRPSAKRAALPPSMEQCRIRIFAWD